MSFLMACIIPLGWRFSVLMGLGLSVLTWEAQRQVGKVNGYWAAVIRSGDLGRTGVAECRPELGPWVMLQGHVTAQWYPDRLTVSLSGRLLWRSHLWQVEPIPGLFGF